MDISDHTYHLNPNSLPTHKCVLGCVRALKDQADSTRVDSGFQQRFQSIFRYPYNLRTHLHLPSQGE